MDTLAKREHVPEVGSLTNSAERAAAVAAVRRMVPDPVARAEVLEALGLDEMGEL